MPFSKTTMWLLCLFLGVVGADIFLTAYLLLEINHGLALIFILPALVLPLLIVVPIVALVRTNVAYGIGAVLLAAPGLWLGIPQIQRAIYYEQMVEGMRSGSAYFDTKPERELAAAIIACHRYERDDPSKCDFPRIEALARVANVNANPHQETFMDLALRQGALPEVVGALLRAGETADDAQHKALDSACSQGDADVAVATVLAAGVDPNLRITPSETSTPYPIGTPYVISCVKPAVPALIKAGADVNAQDPNGKTALMYAVRDRNFDLVALLLAHGAREDQVAKDGTTLDQLVAFISPDEVKNLPPDVGAFLKRHR